MIEKMPAGLLRKNNSYYFQARIPKDCLGHYTYAILQEKLPTSDLKIAKALVANRWSVLYEEYARIRSTGTKAKITISPNETQELIAKAIHSRLTADDELRYAGLDDEQFDLMAEGHSEVDQRERKVIARGVFDPLTTDLVAEWLMVGGYEIEEGSPEFIKFAREFVKAQMAVTKAFKERHQGEPIETNDVLSSFQQNQIKEVNAGKAPLLSKVVDYFLQNYDSTRPMFAKHKSVLR